LEWGNTRRFVALGLSSSNRTGLYHAYHSYSIMGEAEIEAVSISILNFNISDILLVFIVLSVSFVIEGNAWRVDDLRQVVGKGQLM